MASLDFSHSKSPNKSKLNGMWMISREHAHILGPKPSRKTHPVALSNCSNCCCFPTPKCGGGVLARSPSTENGALGRTPPRSGERCVEVLVILEARSGQLVEWSGGRSGERHEKIMKITWFLRCFRFFVSSVEGLRVLW